MTLFSQSKRTLSSLNFGLPVLKFRQNQLHYCRDVNLGIDILASNFSENEKEVKENSQNCTGAAKAFFPQTEVLKELQEVMKVECPADLEKLNQALREKSSIEPGKCSLMN